MLKNIALRSAGQMGHYLQSTEDDISVYAYSLEIILIGVCQVVVYLAVAALWGVFLPTLLVMLSHTGFRFFGGGYHLKTFSRCFILSGLMIAILVWASQSPWQEWILWFVLGLTALVALVTIYKWVPAGTEKKSITDLKLRKNQKYKTLIFALLMFGSALSLELHHYPQYAQALILGSMGALFCICPWGYAFWGTLDYILDKLVREV